MCLVCGRRKNATMSMLSGDQKTGYLSAVIRLLLIPLLVYCAWLVESFLLAGYNHLFTHPDPTGLVMYTVISCIVTAMILPVIVIHRAFITGAVNMFQIGFRSARRTVVACSLAGIPLYAAFALANPFGTDKGAFLSAFLLMLPTAIAAVMICWVVAGTHVQAFVREGGSFLSIAVGTVVTSLLFGIMSLALGIAGTGRDALFWPICTGLAAALFFFAVRDVYATALLVAEANVFLSAGSIGPLWIHTPANVIPVTALMSGVVLVGIHWYLSRHYATIPVPVKMREQGL